MFVGMIRMTEEGRRLRDRPFRKKFAGRWKRHKKGGTRRTQKMVGIVRK